MASPKSWIDPSGAENVIFPAVHRATVVLVKPSAVGSNGDQIRKRRGTVLIISMIALHY